MSALQDTVLSPPDHLTAAALLADFEKQRTAYLAAPTPDYRQRKNDLLALKKMLSEHREEIIDAISKDYGNRSRHETLFAEVITVADAINEMWLELNTHSNLIAYSGPALQGNNFSWMDVHHCDANKGSAVTSLKKRLGASNIICFGDSDNDLSMFAFADESYAPENAKAEIKKSASAVIGHNHGDGIAHFLRERFSL